VIRVLALAAILPAIAAAQLQWFTFDGTTEKPITPITDLGTVASGDARDLRIRLRNTGSSTATVQNIAIKAQGYALNPTPLFPIFIAPAGVSEFRVRFAAVTPGSYPAALAVGSLQTMLRATVVASATISLANDQIGSVLAPGSTLDFGRLKRGTSASQQLRIGNGTGTSLSIQTCAATGTSFRLAGISCPMTLAPGDAVNATLYFEPQTSGQYQGTLTIDSRAIPLAGVGFDPPLPRPSIRFESLLESGAQRPLSVQLATPSETKGTGTVTLEFRAADTLLPDDPAIRFIASGGRILPLVVKEGDTTAQIGSGLSSTFQTGTTTGVIVFTVKLGDYNDQFTFPLAPLPISIDIATLSRRTGTLDVAITGFDNTRTSGKCTFTFYDTGGHVLQPGPIRADWSDLFSNYFRSSRVGGMFAMRATFPVSGDASGIGSVEIEMTNSSGVARTSRVR
jgi:hypothetical protein